MKLYVSSLILSSIISVCLAAPRNAHLEERQRDKTYTITCLGPLCTDYPPTTVRIPTSIVIPSFPGGEDPKTTSTIKSTPPKTTVPPTSKKTSTTSKYTPPAETSKYTPPPTTKTVKSTAIPTKTTAQPGGPSSTKCPVPRYYQCGGYFGGKEWAGCTVCEPGSNCVYQNDFYYQCVEDV